MPIKRHTNQKRIKQIRKASDDRRGSARERGYTTAWDRFARGWLQGHPLCFYCANQGRTAAAELVDHIVPHRQIEGRFWPDDGEEWSDFFAACCRECHDGPKRRAETIADNMNRDVREVLHRWGMLPDGFRGVDPDAAIPNSGATLIVGPPAAGKSTLARARQQDGGGVIYDLDDIAEAIGLPRYARSHAEAIRAIQERDIMLLKHSPRKKLIMITSAPTSQERRYWEGRLNTTATILIEPRDVLVDRIRRRSRGDDLAFTSQIDALDRWFGQADI